MNEHVKELKRITEVLLHPEDDFGDLKNAIDDLYQLFATVSEMGMELQENREDVYLPQGKAIGPFWAGMCIKEMLRTKRFISGLYSGIKAAQKKFANTQIHIVYAGTGPFATLAIPLTTVFSSDEISFTFLEINSHSIESVKKIIKAFQVEKYVTDVIQCDATTYQADGCKPIHIVITETMQNALQKEPQVGITLNLVPQMVEGGRLIPENIIIEAVLLDPQRNMDRMLGCLAPEEKCYYPLARIFELNKDTALSYKIAETQESFSFPKVEIDIPKDVPEGYMQLSLFTTIQVFADDFLTPWQSSLNQPQKILEFDQTTQRVDRISFHYQISEESGFKYAIVDKS